MVKRLGVLWLAALFFVPACSSSEEKAQSGDGEAFVGTVEGTDAYIGLVSDGGKVAGYATDGKTLSIWLQPSEVENSLAELRSRTGDFEGAVEFFEGGARGEINFLGAPFSFEAAPASGEAGVYWDEESGSESGWVVSSDGSARGVKSVAGSFSDAGSPKGSPVTDPDEKPFQPR